MKQAYVAGFLMDYRMDRFLVIDKKNSPKLFGPGVKLKIQAIGGKMQEIGYSTGEGMVPKGSTYEFPHDAMSREFQEETGTTILPKLWHCFLIKEYQEVKLYLFVVFRSPNELDQIVHHAQSIDNKEGEIKIVDLIDVFFDPEKFTFDTPAMISFIKLEMTKGFFLQLDPEGINSAYKNS